MKNEDSLLETLSRISQLALHKKKQRAYDRAEKLTRIREEISRRKNIEREYIDFIESASNTLLGAAINGSKEKKIECNSIFSKRSIIDELLSTPISEKDRKRINRILTSLIPAEIEKISQAIREIVPFDYPHFKIITQSLEILRTASMSELNSIVDSVYSNFNNLSNYYLEISEKREILRRALDIRTFALKQNLNAVLREHQAYLNRSAALHPTTSSENPHSRDDRSIFNLRQALKLLIPTLSWEERDLPRSQLRIIFYAAINDIDITEAIEKVLVESNIKAEAKILEILLLAEDDILDSSQLRGLQRTTKKSAEKILKLRDECVFVLSQSGYSDEPIIGREFENKNIYSMGTKNPKINLYNYFLSSSGRREVSRFREILIRAASAGQKSVELRGKFEKKQFFLEYKNSAKMKFPGRIDDFLQAVNHESGFGIGYEYFEGKPAEFKLKLYWDTNQFPV